MSKTDLQATLVGPPVIKLVLEPLAVLGLDNQLYMLTLQPFYVSSCVTTFILSKVDNFFKYFHRL